MTSYKLQKLVYYAQAVHLASSDERLFGDRIEAWRDGPCTPALYERHRQRYLVETVAGDPSRLDADEMNSIRRALVYYGNQSAEWLVNQTHLEDPWHDARRGAPDHSQGRNEISVEAIRDFYARIFDDPEVESALAAIEPTGGLTADELRAKYASHR